MGALQLEMETAISARRLSLFDRYHEALTPLADRGVVRLPSIPQEATGNGHMFYLLMPDGETRDDFINYMRERDVISPFYYIPLHSSPAGLAFGRTHGSLEVTDRISRTLVRLPMFFDLGSQVEDVIDHVFDFFDQSPAHRVEA